MREEGKLEQFTRVRRRQPRLGSRAAVREAWRPAKVVGRHDQKAAAPQETREAKSKLSEWWEEPSVEGRRGARVCGQWKRRWSSFGVPGCEHRGQVVGASGTDEVQPVRGEYVAHVRCGKRDRVRVKRR